MSDGPHFPPPTRKEADPYRAVSTAPTETRAPVIATRAEPPASEPEHVKLTRDEVRALLAVQAARRPPWRSSLRRSAVLFPAGLVAQGLHIVLGGYALPFELLVLAAAFVWIARPLFRHDDFA
jgi:hypothetical protein